MRNSHRILLNTGVTYAKAVITAVISLYSTRLILEALGADDFGLYNVVGGMVAMLAFLNAAMTTSTQRFISFNLGKGDMNLVKKTFANGVVTHLVIGVVVFFLIELVAIYLINTKLKINVDRIETAKYILHFTAISTLITIISVPYDAVINAHENMTFLAVVSVFESVLKLIVAFSVLYLPGDKLYYYGVLTMVSAILIRIIKRSYSKKMYEECRIKALQWYELKEIKVAGSFAGWSLFGSLCALGRNQGVAVVLNMFYSTAINAGYGIANQVNAQLMFFSQTMMSAIRPQIMKSEGANDRSRMISLSLTANRLAFYLFTFFAIPLYFQMPFILKSWLGNVPEFTAEFCRTILLLTMVNQINMGVMTAVQAIGKIKVYQVVAGGIQLLTLPIGFILLHFRYPPHFILLGSFILECASTIFRIFYFKYLTGYSPKKYFFEVIIKSLLTAIPAVIVAFLISRNGNEGWISLLLVTTASSLIYLCSIYFIGINEKERLIIMGIYQKIKNKIL